MERWLGIGYDNPASELRVCNVKGMLEESRTRVVLQCGFAVCRFDFISSRGLFDAEDCIWLAGGLINLIINHIFVFFVWRHGIVEVA